MGIPLPDGIHPLLWFNELITAICLGAAAALILLFNNITIKKYKALKADVNALKETEYKDD